MGNMWIGFSSTLVANIIIMIGVTSLYSWLAFDGQNRLGKNRDLKILLLEIGFLVFLQAEDWSTFLLTKTSTGYYWAYLNMEIVILFNCTITNRNRWQLGLTILAPEAWILSYLGTTIDPVVLVLYSAAVVVAVLLYRFYQQILDHYWLYVIAFVTYATLAFTIASQLYAPQPTAAWGRQIFALVVIELVCALYGGQLYNRASQNRAYRRRAVHDELTGLRNFASFNHDLEGAFRQFHATGTRYALHEIDIDHFKGINDHFGHLAGNEVLREVAHCLEQIVDELDYDSRVYRTGGEEFMVLVKFDENSTNAAVQVANRLRTSIRDLRFEFEPDLMVTVSIGQERVSDEDVNYLDIYKRVDKSLYQSKDHGRDVITVRGKTLERKQDVE